MSPPTLALDRAGAALLLLAALVVGARGLGAPFNRSFPGYQGAFFAIAAIDYERFGVASSAGYPTLALDGPSLGGLDDVAPARSSPERAVYRNHPPTAFLLAWGSIRLFAPSGWSEAWREHRPPTSIETPERIPFLVLHLVALLALWWTMRTGFGPSAALIALALYATAPVALLFGPRANLETPALPFVLFAVGLHARWLRDTRSRDLVASAACLAVGSAITWAPLFFVPPLVVQALVRRGWRAAARSSLALAPASALPLGAHALLSRASGAPDQDFVAHARLVLAPLSEGSRPLAHWMEVQFERALEALGPALLAAACAGLVLAIAHGAFSAVRGRLAPLAAPGRHADPIDVAAPLLAGALLYLFAFYRYTLEDQPQFRLWLAPAAAALAARGLDALSRMLLRFRAGIAPHVAAVALVALPSIARAEAWKSEIASAGGLPAPIDLAAQVQDVVPKQGFTIAPAALGFDLQTAFYAWRNLVPVSSEEEIRQWLDRLPTLADMPRYVLTRTDGRWAVTSSR